MSKRKWFRSKLEAQKLYREFNKLHLSCWACGATNKPTWWYGPWLPNERAHIVAQPRVEDVRVIVCLCSTCHRIQTNSTFPELRDVPALKLEHLIHLKLVFDSKNYDHEFLEKHSVRKIPMPAELPDWYVNQRRKDFIEF